MRSWLLSASQGGGGKSGSNSNGTWIKFADGTIMQSGICTTAGWNRWTNITFPIPFKEKVDVVIASPYGNYSPAGDGSQWLFTTNNWTLTGFRFFYWDNVGMTKCSWIAIGH